jgi:hypothetical protein
MNESTSQPPGIIAADCVYQLDDAQARLGLGKQAWRTARREGLPIRRVGRRRYVIGRDVITWLQTRPTE